MIFRNVQGLHFSRIPQAVFCLLLFSAGFASCEPHKLSIREIRIERASGGQVTVKAEIARTEAERSRGLMFRRNVPDGEGMLFLFERDQPLSFWMKNTFVPLSIAYIARDGRIIDIRDMQPHDLNPVKSSRSVRYALEVPQGWFNHAGIQPGDLVIDIPFIQ